MKQHLLSKSEIDRAIKSYPAKKRLNDGAGLVLLINSPTSQSWIYRYEVHGTEKRMGLGAYPGVTLADARRAAQTARGQRAQGIDPMLAKKQARRVGITFEEAAREYWQAHCQDLAKPSNWIAGMERHVFPVVGKRAVVDMIPEDLIKVFKPIWGREMTRKLAQWVNNVILYVATDDSRVDTDLMEKVKNRLGPQRVKNTGHAAVHWEDVPNLWIALPKTLVGVSMKLLILTCVRDDAIVRARWEEFDQKRGIWRIPAERVKGWPEGFEVPVTPLMSALLRVADKFRDDTGYVFPSPASKAGHLSNNAHRLWLHKHGWKDRDGRLASAHGFRASFRTWSDDHRHDRAIAEHCLQHVSAKGGQVERAYARSGRFEERRELLVTWGRHVSHKAVELSEVRRQEHNAERWIAELEMDEAEFYRGAGFKPLDLVDDEDRGRGG